jgi:S-adenosylmethionine:tRNA ribosyltransferase-isomerase
VDVAEFDFELPPELIAQSPLDERDACRLLVVERDAAGVEHRTFRDVVELLAPGTLLILNETRVIPARLFGRRATGGRVEVLLIRPLPGTPPPEEGQRWEALVKAGGTLRPGEELSLDGGAALRLVERTAPGRYEVAFGGGVDVVALANEVGHMPLPPYVQRPDGPGDRSDYQTVFARVPGAIAAPTAGLHFTPELLASLERRGVEQARVTLHVGLGTFCPMRVERVEEHVMEAERYSVPESTQRALRAARAEGRPILACGTTAVRALEAYARTGQAEGETELFVYPGYEFQLVDGLITNFHLPRSTLLLLVSALAGWETIRGAYQEAVREGYRFYSYGDAMLIRPTQAALQEDELPA